MGAFDKTLEFIKNCSIEELTKELSGYGIEFKEKRNLNRQNPESLYHEITVSVSNSFNSNSALLRFYATVHEPGCFYFPDIDSINWGNNTFVISQEEDAA